MSINFAFRALYTSDLWLCAEDASAVAESGYNFLAGYAELALLSWQDALGWFAQHPKVHALEHSFEELESQAAKFGFALNPLAYSAQMDEDFVGKASRLSRTVHPKRASRRTMQRYLCAARMVWQAVLDTPDS